MSSITPDVTHAVDFVDAFASSPDAGVQLCQAVVAAFSAPNLSIQIGTTVIAGVHWYDTYWPVVNDTVWVMVNGADLTVIGPVATAASTDKIGTLQTSVTTNTANITTLQGQVTGLPLIRYGHASPFTNAAGGASVSFSSSFPSACSMVVATVGDATTYAYISIQNWSTSGFNFVAQAAPGTPAGSRTLGVNYIAMGS